MAGVWLLGLGHHCFAMKISHSRSFEIQVQVHFESCWLASIFESFESQLARFYMFIRSLVRVLSFVEFPRCPRNFCAPGFSRFRPIPQGIANSKIFELSAKILPVRTFPIFLSGFTSFNFSKIGFME